jgi:hypothetical protein
MGQTSIPCSTTARDELAETKPPEMSWSEYLLALRDESDQLKQGAVAPSEFPTPLTYDDAKNACAAALREELPDEVLQR